MERSGCAAEANDVPRPARPARAALPARRRAGAESTRSGLAALALVLLVAPATLAAEERAGPVLELESITYVASRAGRREMVLDAARARLRPEEQVVYLQEVRAHIAADARTQGLDMTCDRGTFDLETNGFVAEGHVRGTTGDGRRFRTSRLRYDHEARVVATDAPVRIRDATGHYRGGGFRYHVDEARFQLLGGATVVQEP